MNLAAPTVSSDAPPAMDGADPQWYAQSAEEVLKTLNVDSHNGLASEEVARRRQTHGSNELIEAGIKSPWLILREQFADTMVVVLIIAAAVSYIIEPEEILDPIVIMLIVVMNATLGFVQEYRAEQAMAALRQLSAPSVRVRRDGLTSDVPIADIVPGDIVLLEAGSTVPADARVLESASLRAQEAALTGESEAVDKETNSLPKSDHVPLGDRKNMIYRGTSIVYGRGSAVVVSTGMRTELGRIAALIQSVDDEETPLQRKMAELGRSLGIAALLIVIVVFVFGLIRGVEITEMFLTAIALAVAAVPEGLPAVVTIALALGAQRMLRRNALIRKLPAVETLGSVTVICTDKTGTLTQNQMTVRVIDVAGLATPLTEAAEAQRTGNQPEQIAAQKLTLIGSALCNDALLQHDTREGYTGYQMIGDPTEGALLFAARAFDIRRDNLDEVFPRIGEAPFSSERKRMTTLHRIDPEPGQLDEVVRHLRQPYVSFTKGSVDGLLEIARHVWITDHAEPMTDDLRKRIEEANNGMASDGLRVLGIAFRMLDEIPDKVNETSLEHDLILVGMVGMIDPPRPEVKDAVAVAKSAGIRPVMITGDHPLTALTIAGELGILTPDRPRVLTGHDLVKMSAQDLEAVADEVSVFARVSPENKLDIVQAFQSKGHIVAMTGDGVNDAPALRKGDIGVAMGITGTDVSKEASDMVLLDDNFATIVAAVEQGRTIYDNVRKFMKYILTSNVGEILVMFTAPFFGLPLPLTPIQILWVNLVTDGLPGLALGVEPTERNAMRRKPFDPNESVFSRGIGTFILWVGFLLGALSLGVGVWGARMGLAEEVWKTMVFTTLTLAQMANAIAVRSNDESLFTIGLFSNQALLGAVLLTFMLQLGVIYLPFAQEIFDTTALSLNQFLVCLALSSVIFIAVEIEKLIRRLRTSSAA